MNATLPLFATQQTKQFHFEGNLPHQQRAVDSILAVLETVTFTKPNQQDRKSTRLNSSHT